MLVASIIGVSTLGIHVLTSNSKDVSIIDMINHSKNICSVPDGAFRELLRGHLEFPDPASAQILC